MIELISALDTYLKEHPLTLGNCEDVLDMLFEFYFEHNSYDNEIIKADFHALYVAMNGMPLKEMDQIIYPVCELCHDHQRAGFIDGIKIGMMLHPELQKEGEQPVR